MFFSQECGFSPVIWTGSTCLFCFLLHVNEGKTFLGSDNPNMSLIQQWLLMWNLKNFTRPASVCEQQPKRSWDSATQRQKQTSLLNRISENKGNPMRSNWHIRPGHSGMCEIPASSSHLIIWRRPKLCGRFGATTPMENQSAPLRSRMHKSQGSN